MTKVALIGGAWSSNIGNSFYNIGAEWLLQDIGANVFFFPESPRWKENVPESYDAVSDINADLFILVGPCLWERLAYVYEETFQKLYERGKSVAYISAGMSSYSEKEVNFIADFFTKFPPSFVSTRDHSCYKLLSQSSSFPLYNGICSSMFLNDSIQPPTLEHSPFIVLNFDTNEPELSFSEDGTAKVLKKRNKKFPTSINNYSVIRTNNLSIDVGYKKIYSRPNSYHSDLPYGYISILASAKTVYSERVHTCAATLIYGGKAQFIRYSNRSFDKRSLLFDRLQVSSIFERPTSLDMDFIEVEKNNMKDFMRFNIF